MSGTVAELRRPLYPQLNQPDLARLPQDRFVDICYLVDLDFRSLEREDEYDPEAHGLALDWDTCRSECIRRKLWIGATT